MDLHVVPETASATLLDRPLRSVADIEAIESVSLERYLGVMDFPQRVLLGLASRSPGDTALTYVPDGDVDRIPERIVSSELRAKIDRVRGLLRAQGIGHGDVVGILLPTIPSMYWAVLGAMCIGIAFPVNWMLEPKYLFRLLKEADVKAIIALGPAPGFGIWEALSEIARSLPEGIKIWSVTGPGGVVLHQSDLDSAIVRQSDDAPLHETRSDEAIVAYVHSGGTTGLPKIVKLSNRNLSYRHWSLQLTAKYVIGELILHDAPMFHIGGLIGRWLAPVASGASALIPSVMGARDKRYIANYWKFVEKYRVTRLSGVPTTLAVLAKSAPVGLDLSSLSPYFITGSTVLPSSVREAFERASAVRVLNSYGMTENCASIAIDPRDGPNKPGSSGIRLPFTQIRVVPTTQVDDDSQPCEPGKIGMLEVKGPGVSPGYVNPAHERGTRSEDGWLITGDLGHIDSDGYVFVTGRSKDIIIRSGHNIDPSIIEEPLLQLTQVLHAAAVAKPDHYAGELPVAYVQLMPGSQTTPAELMTYLSTCIAERAALPKEVFIVEELPLTEVGKPIKAILRKDAAERTFRAVIAAATEWSSEGGDFEVTIRSHPEFGETVVVALRGVDVAARAGKSAAIERAMSGYHNPYTIVWR